MNWHITHAPKHWSNEATMIDYIKEIIIPYVESQRHQLQQCSPALVIMDNFRGQVTPAINNLLEENDIHVSLLPPNTTDRLQPMDISVNKPAKDFLKRKFQEWYADQVTEQLVGQDVNEVELDLVNT